MILGDFNHNIDSYAIDNSNYSTGDFSPPSTQVNLAAICKKKTPHHLWHEFLNNYLHECTHSRDVDLFLPTFRKN